MNALLFRPLVFILVLIASLTTTAQGSTDNLKLYDFFQPVSKSEIFRSDTHFNWGASIIKGNNGTYHLFYSRWKRSLGFTAWLTHSEIAHATSKSPSGPWKFKEVVLKGRRNGKWDAITAHNPKIKYFQGKYYLYYISTHMGQDAYTEEDLIEIAATGYQHPKWQVLRPNQRTGVAVSESLKGPWKRMDQALIEPSGPISTLTVNPAIEQGDDGKYYLIVKGDKPNETRFIRNQAIAVSDHPVGPFKLQDKPVINDLDTEDASIWYDKNRKRFYAVFHAHDFIGMITSEDGINWKKSNEYVLHNKRIRRADGSLIEPDRMERPFVFHENGEPRVLSLAVKKGNDTYTVFIPIKIPDRPVPNHRQLAWQEAELGVVFHYDLHVFDGKKYNQAENRINPIQDYQIFNPRSLDTDQWVRAAKDAGAKFAILTASHETGFALFQSAVNPYSLRALNWKKGQGDILKDFVNSCKKYGIKPGVYIGIRWNSLLGVHDFKINGSGDFAENRQKRYNTMVEGMVKEICTNYGEWFEIWFDGGADHPDNGAPDVLPIVRRYQPNALFYHNGQLAEARWGGSESGTVSDPCWATFPYHATGAGESAKKNIYKDNYRLLKQGDPIGQFWMPAMSDAPLRGFNGRHEWFWEPDDEAHIFPLENLIDMYYKSVGRNSTLILGLTPDPSGLLPESDVKRLKELGDEIKRRFSNPLAFTEGNGRNISLPLNKPTLVNHIVIQEDIFEGERIRLFEIKGRNKGKWVRLYKGQSVGQKRIIEFDDTEVDRIKLQIIKSTGEPKVKNLSAFFVSEN